MLTGFAGAAIAAELGTMVVGEEIEALEAQALNPIRFLAVPRVIATVISLVLLTVIGDVVAIATACIVSVEMLDVPYELYKVNTLGTLWEFQTCRFSCSFSNICNLPRVIKCARC